jgi:tRNA (guanine10-N2)-methyltransferase
VSLRFCLELWAQDKQNEDLHHSLRAYSIENSNIIAEDRKSFKIVVETFCKHFSQHEKVNKIEVSKHFNIKLIYFKII